LDKIPAGFFGIVGLVIGSFLNVCIYRIPKGESLVWPGSHCPECGRGLKPFDLIPVVSYVLLRGKCRSCGFRIPARYPLVEMLTGISFYWAATASAGSPLNFLNYILFLSGLTVIFFIDLDHLIIPDRIALPLLLAGLILAAFIKQDGRPVFVDHLVGTVVGFAVFFLIAWGGMHMLRFEDRLGMDIGASLLFMKVFYKGDADVGRDAMGGGDVKLAAMMGAFLGLKLLAAGLFLSFLIGSVVSIGLLMSGRKGAKDAVPFGPMMAAGGVLALIKGQAIINWYADLMARLWI
jgi:leader peptidase (prepilin peptidase) / N-methyltransferase